MPQPPVPPFNNQGLFADHYLQDVLPQDPSLWDAADMVAARDGLLALWREQESEVADHDEAQLEEHFIKPALAILGHTWEVQPRAGQHRPDYAFFADDETRAAARPADGRREYWSEALAVGDAKSWERRLDKALSGGSGWDFQNPSFQIYHYLAETGCRWAILTNGRHWRLYCAEPKPDMEVHYEVDLPELLEAEDVEAFAYFWLFFRPQAFLPDAEGLSFLDRVRTESELAAERLREDVREHVYRALLEACRGFLSHRPNNLTDAELTDVYDNALVLLYRLLFQLYAEAAEHLPLRGNTQYRNRYSLHAVKHEIAEDASVFVEGLTALWSQLTDLFGVIDQGHPALGVPAYNGGLFDSDKHPFLEACAMSDQHVARVVDLLARTPAGRFVDYRDLGVRHIGSIYEGLLEYRLARAGEPMVVVRQRGKDLWVPVTGADKPRPDAERCEAGDLYLVTDRGERLHVGRIGEAHGELIAALDHLA